METRDIEATTPESGDELSAQSASRAALLRPRDPAASSCPSCGSKPLSGPTQDAGGGRNYIYAIGQLESRFPSVSVEKEFAQVVGRVPTNGKTDRETFYTVLSDPHNVYIARQLCWIMNISGVDTYVITPRNPADFGLLVESVRPSPDPGSLDAVIGTRGPMAPPDMCNGVILPLVFFDQMPPRCSIESLPPPTMQGLLTQTAP
jgi:hypothetical protein